MTVGAGRPAGAALLGAALVLAACVPPLTFPLPPPEPGAARRAQALARQQETELAGCADAAACAQAHFILGLLALSEDPRAAVRHLRAAAERDPKGRLAASSRAWITLIEQPDRRADGAATAVAALVRDLAEREALLQQLARGTGYPSVEALRQELAARERRIALLTQQLEAIKRVERELREKARPLWEPGHLHPGPSDEPLP